MAKSKAKTLSFPDDVLTRVESIAADLRVTWSGRLIHKTHDEGTYARKARFGDVVRAACLQFEGPKPATPAKKKTAKKKTAKKKTAKKKTAKRGRR